MRLRHLFLAIILSATWPDPALAQAEAASQAQPGAEAAFKLATLVVPDDLADIEVRRAREAIYAGFRADEGLVELENEYPGLHDAMWHAVEPILRDYSAKSGPGLVARLRDLYAARLSREEIDAFIAFYSTPTGKRLIRTVYENADYAPFVEAGLADRATTAEDIGRVQQSARAAVAESLTEADRAALEELVRSISLTKANALSAEIRQITADWLNEPDPEMDALIEEAVVSAAERHMAKVSSGD